MPDFRPAPDQREEMRREKMRKTYFFRAWRIDISTVTTTYSPPDGSQRQGAAVQSHEVEIELDSFHLQRNLEAKLAGKPHKLWELLSDFLFTARDLAAIAGETRPLALPPALPPAVVEAEDEAIDERGRVAFRNRYGSIVEPVIGHYLYRLAAPRGEPALLPLPEPAPPTPPAQPEVAASLEAAAVAAQPLGAKRRPTDAASCATAEPASKAARAEAGQEAFEEMSLDSGSESPEAFPAGQAVNSWDRRSKDWEDALGF